MKTRIYVWADNARERWNFFFLFFGTTRVITIGTILGAVLFCAIWFL